MWCTLEVPPAPPDPLLPGMGLLMVSRDLLEEEVARQDASFARQRRPRRRPRRGRVAVVVALLLAFTAAGILGLAAVEARRDVRALTDEIRSVRTELGAALGRAVTAEATAATLAERVDELRGRLAALRERKVRTVVRTRTVTETVTETVYVPNGEDVSVEVTGFEGMVRIYDVRLTHSYGYSDLIGIAENTSGRVIAYAQLGCSFLDRDGRLLAAGMDNKEDWRPGQSWGFVCSAEVDATGAILRVDELA